MEAELTNIYHLSSHDGYGARTTLFFKGCSLHCAWCHNPETIALGREVMWKRELCIGCGECMKACQQGALHLGGETNYIERKSCIACGACAEACPSKAMHLSSKTYSVEDTAKIIRRDKPLFQSMKGGVTFSGGEPALHSKYINAVIEELSDESIHYALDTCGQAPFSAYELLLPKMELILFDVKIAVAVKHKASTGSDNKLIFENLAKIVSYIEENSLSTKIWIRTPLIPTHTANNENIEAIAELLSKLSASILERWEMCCFNNLCTDKYRQLGVDWPLRDYDLLSSDEAAEYLSIAKNIAPDLDIRVTGLRKRDL